MPPKKQKGIFSDEVECFIIKEIERRPVLWDTTSEVYKRADLKGPAFESVAKVIQEITGNLTLTGKTVGDRWKSIKSTFTENEKKIREYKNKCSGSGTDDVYKPKWPLFGKLLFLRKTVAQAQSTSNVVVPHGDTTPVSQLVDIYFGDNLRAFRSIPPDNTESDTLSTFGGSDDSIASQPFSPLEDTAELSGGFAVPRARPVSALPTPAPSQSPLFQKRGGKKSSSALDEAVQVMNDIAAQPVIPKEDSAGIFGNLVAERLREIETGKEIQSRRECECQLMTVLSKF